MNILFSYSRLKGFQYNEQYNNQQNHHRDFIKPAEPNMRFGVLSGCEPTQQTLDALMKLDLSAGVDVEIKS